MGPKCTKRIFVVTLLFGVLTASPVSGSHIDQSSTSSGPPHIHKSQQTQKQITPIRKTPVSVPNSSTNSTASSLQELPSTSRTTKQNIQRVKPHTTLGWRFLLNGQTHAAMAAYRQALRQNPHSARAYLGLGMVLKSMGKIDMAKKALVKAVNLDAHLPSALVHLGYLYAEGHFGQADLTTARRLFREASQLGDPFASIALLDMKSRLNL